MRINVYTNEVHNRKSILKSIFNRTPDINPHMLQRATLMERYPGIKNTNTHTTHASVLFGFYEQLSFMQYSCTEVHTKKTCIFWPLQK